jgi:hypothetical protein
MAKSLNLLSEFHSWWRKFPIGTFCELLTKSGLAEQLPNAFVTDIRIKATPTSLYYFNGATVLLYHQLDRLHPQKKQQ